MVASYLKHRAERETALFEALGRGGKNVSELLAEVYRDVPSELHAFAARFLGVGLGKLGEEQRAVPCGETWVLADGSVRW